MTFNPLAEKGIPIEKQLRNWSELNVEPAATGDEILKTSLATFGLSSFEIASFDALIVLGTAADRAEEVRMLQRCLNQERAMAAWLAENQRGLIMAHLQLRSEGQPANR